jgi:hypothetical protein
MKNFKMHYSTSADDKGIVFVNEHLSSNLEGQMSYGKKISPRNNQNKDFLEPQVCLSPPSSPFDCIPFNISLEHSRRNSPTDFNPIKKFNNYEIWENQRNVNGKPQDIRYVLKELDDFNLGRWTSEEKSAFRDGYAIHGAQWSLIAKDFVKTRSAIQVTSYGCRRRHKSPENSPSRPPSCFDGAGSESKC